MADNNDDEGDGVFFIPTTSDINQSTSTIKKKKKKKTNKSLKTSKSSKSSKSSTLSIVDDKHSPLLQVNDVVADSRDVVSQQDTLHAITQTKKACI